MSLSSLGLIDFRSDKERIARNTKKTAKNTRKSLELARQQAQAPAQVRYAPQPGYPQVTYGSAPQANYPQATSGSTPQATPAADPVERLRQLGELRAAGTITEEEFNRLKAQIIG